VVAEVDEGKNEMMGGQEIRVFAVVADEQRPEFVDPSKGAFAAEAAFVDLGSAHGEITFSEAFPS
jgi:hypothetical protein